LSASRRAGAGHDGRQHQPRVHPRAAGQQRLERFGHLGPADVGQEAEPAEVHADERHVTRRVRDRARRVEQRSVAAEGNDDVGRCSQIVAVDDVPARLRAGQARCLGTGPIDDRGAPVRLEPLGGFAHRLERFGQGGTREQRGAGEYRRVSHVDSGRAASGTRGCPRHR
jgi:hypothetical protein